jgi:hypothetical protein|tara:strand:- start:1350 stop:2873 length:1524 start_codon:yes stop_codon:yes gene_type:complete
MIDKIKIISLDTIDVQSMTPIYERSKHWGNQDFSRWVFKDESTQLYYKIWNETYVKRNGIVSGLLSGLYDETTVPALVGLIFWEGVCRGYVMEHLGDVHKKEDMISNEDYPKFYNHILQKVKDTSYFPYDLCQKHMRKYKDTISLMDLEGVHHIDEYEYRLKEHNDLGIKGLFINNSQWEKDIHKIFYTPLSEEDFLDMTMHEGGGGKQIISNGYELKTIRDIVKFYSDKNNVDNAKSQLVPSNWQYFNCMLAEFRHNVGDHHALGWENMTKEYYESLPTMSDEEITSFLRDNTVPFEVGFVKHGFHRACSMIGRLINGKSYIPFYMNQLKYPGYTKNPIDNVNFIRVLDEFGIPRTEYSIGNSAMLAVMGIDCRVNKNGDLDIVLSSKLRKFLERSEMRLPNSTHPFGKDSGKFRVFGCKDDDDLVYNYSVDINGYNFIEPRFYFSRMHRLMQSAHRSFEENRRIKELGKIGVDEFDKKQKYHSKPFRNIEYEQWGFDLVEEVRVV